jgi:protocatechuate 3,4-dioxygenase beta subunit
LFRLLINFKKSLMMTMTKKLLILIPLISIFYGIKLQAQITAYNPSAFPISKCTDGATISMNVGTAGTVVVTMPPNINYTPSSVTGATEVAIGASTVTFSVAAPGVVTYKHQATCDVNEALSFTDEAVLNADPAVTSNAYNVAEAAPQVTLAVNAPAVANVGQLTTRTVTLTNGGIGKVSDWYYQDIVVTGSYLFNTSNVLIGAYTIPAAQVSVTSGGGFDTLTVHLTATDMAQIGNNDSYFDGNDPTIGAPPQETFNLTYEVTPLNCGSGYAINSTHRSYYGCGSVCSDLTFSSLLDINIPTAPNLTIGYTGTFPSCIDENVAIPRTLTITNSGGPATDVNISFGNYYAFYSNHAYQSYVDTATFKYSINGGPLQTPTFSNVYVNGPTWYDGDPINPAMVGKPSLFTFTIPAIPAGAVVTIAHNIYKGCDGNFTCPAGNESYYHHYEEQFYVKNPSNYKNGCGDLTYNFPEQYLSYRGLNHSTTLEYPTDMVGGQTATFKSLIISGLEALVEIPSGAYLEINTTLPPGYTLMGSPDAVSDVITWPATTTQVGNVVTSRFYFPKPANFDMAYFKYNMDLNLNCALRANGDPTTIFQNHKFVQDPACACSRDLVCVQNTPIIHCPGPCPEGINNLYANTARKNFGLPDANNDGVADAGPYNTSLMDLSRAFYGDTVEYTYGGTIGWNPANGVFTNGYAESNINNFAGKFVALDADVRVFVGGVLSQGPIFFTPVVNGNILTTDFSSMMASINQGDSIVTRMRVRVTDPALVNGQQEIGFTSLNYMYASRIANPLPADTTAATGRRYCDLWGGTINTVSYYYTYDGYGPTVIGCNQNYLIHYSYFSVGVNGTNNYSQKSTRFPYEVRNWSYADKALFLLPPSYGYSVDSASIVYYRTAGLTSAPGKQIFTAPYTVSGDSVFVDLKQHYAAFGGPADNIFSDDGWVVYTYLYVSTNCKTTIAASPIGMGWNLTTLDTNHVPSSYTYNPTFPTGSYNQVNQVWPVASGIRYIQSNPVQLVAGGGGVKNVAGKEFYYPNVVVSNQTNSPSSFGYVYFATGANTTLTEVTYLGNPIVPDANGYYSISGFAGGEAKNLTVKGTTTSCLPDTIKMYYGWDCKQLPTSAPTLASQCYPPLNLILRPLPAKIDGNVTPLQFTPPNPATGVGTYGSTTVDMCAPFPVELVINSAVQGTIYDILANTQLPAGVTYQAGSAYYEHPIGSTPVQVSAAQEATLAAAGSGGTLPFDVQLMSSNSIDSLQGTVANPASIRQIKIRFLASPSCDYNGKGRVRATLLAKRGCGNNAINNGTIKSGNTIKLTPPAGTFAVTVTPSLPAINGCGTTTAGSLTINKTDAAIPTSLDSISMSIPSGVDINNITCTACSPALGAPNVVDDGTTKTLTWNYPSGNVTGIITINFDATVNNNATCNNPNTFEAAVLQQKVLFCSGLPCPGATTVEAGTGSANFNINLPTFSITGVNATTYSTLAPFTYDISSTITNTSTVTASSYKILYAYDVDGDSLITNTDIILQTDVVNTPLAGGASVVINKDYTTVIPSNGADLIIGILPLTDDLVNGSCACGEAYGYASITQGLTASLGDKVWNDLNNDGVQDAGEVGVAGITVTLYDQNNVVVATTVTDAYGNYLFDDLVPGDYSVGFTLPQNYEFSPSTGTSEGDATNSDVNPTTGKTTSVTLSAGENQLNIDAGIHFTQPTTASVGNYVWNDTDGDGIQDANEVGISGVTVTLYDNSGNPVATVITDANGFYEFTNVVPGTYTVGFTPPVGYVTSPNNGGVNDPSNSDANPLTGQTAAFVVNAGDRITYVDAGFTPQNAANASLGDKVWNDLNQDGIQDAGEPGVAGVTVTLYGSDGVTVIGTTTTDAFGNYVFNNLTPGTYVVGFSTPSGYTLTTPGAGSDSTLNSDAIIATGKTAPIVLAAGQNNMTIDAGIYNTNPANTNSIGDKVWNDLDQDGIQDANEPGISGVTVTLYDNIGNVVAITSTDANGNYLFPNLPNGTYTVGFSNLPNGFIFTQTGQGTSSTDSDPNPSTGITSPITLSGNTNVTDVDAGLVQGNTRIGTATLGDRVWYDLDGDGIQDAGESGVAGVTVTLYAADGTTVLATTTTDALGNYIFTGLDAGSYIVGFSNLPAGFTVSPENADAQGINGEDNSDVNAGTLRTPTIVLTTGEDKMSVDMGIVPPVGTASLGNFVWYDLDGDGIQDANEPGMQGITVTLYDGAGNIVATTTTDANGEYQFVGLAPGTYSVGFTNLPNGFSFAPENADATGINGATNSDANPTTGRTGTVTLISGENNTNLDAGIITTTKASLGDYVWNDINGNGIQDPNEPGVAGVLVTLYDNLGNPISSTITGPNGEYLFANLDPGTYQVGFSNLPSGMVFTTQEVDPNSPTGSNVNPTTGLSAPVTLTAGGFNPTIDAGLTTPPTAGLGNYVWNDVDQDGIQDAGEPGVSGVLVTLYASDGTTVLGTAITDGNGAYSFTNLPSGTYVVGFSNLPLGYTRTQVVGSLNDGNNSDMNMGGQTNPITLTNGEYNPNIDAGIYFGVPLPARELKAIVAIIKESNVCEVSWFTREEQNTSRFEIERSANGMDFEQVGTTAASGSTQGLTNYSYNDDIAVVNQLSIIYYRIKLIDIDGKFTYSNVISAVRGSSNDALMIYPNPFENALNIDYVAESDDVLELTLTDLSGRVVSRMQKTITKGANKITWNNLGSLSSGQYYIRVSSLENGNSYLRKLNK